MLAALGFSIMTALIKLLGGRLHVTQILFLRQMFMSFLVLPVILRGFPGSMKTRRLNLHLARVALALVAMLTGFTAIIHMPLADATAIGFAKSFFVTIFAIIILKEVVGLRRWGATFVGFCGVLLMLQPGTEGFSIYGVYAVIAAACAGMVMVLIRLMSRTESAHAILSYQAIGVALVMALPAYFNWLWPEPWEWLALVGVGVVSYVSQRGNIYAYKWGEASVLASMDYFRLLYATLLGFILFNTLPSAATIGGAALIVAASLYTMHREAQKRQK